MDTIAEKDSIEPEWTVDEIGEAMEKSMESWPKLLKPMEESRQAPSGLIGNGTVIALAVLGSQRFGPWRAITYD